MELVSEELVMKVIYYEDFEDVFELNKWVNHHRGAEVISIETLPGEIKRLWVRDECCSDVT